MKPQHTTWQLDFRTSFPRWACFQLIEFLCLSTGGEFGGNGYGTSSLGNVGPVRTGKQPDWVCGNGDCKNKNFGWRTSCNRCQVNPTVLQTCEHPFTVSKTALHQDRSIWCKVIEIFGTIWCSIGAAQRIPWQPETTNLLLTLFVGTASKASKSGASACQGKWGWSILWRRPPKLWRLHRRGLRCNYRTGLWRNELGRWTSLPLILASFVWDFSGVSPRCRSWAFSFRGCFTDQLVFLFLDLLPNPWGDFWELTSNNAGMGAFGMGAYGLGAMGSLGAAGYGAAGYSNEGDAYGRAASGRGGGSAQRFRPY